ncbi:MAG: hypothetical protein AB7G06_05435 [Bdellovibrionales bacterium]
MSALDRVFHNAPATLQYQVLQQLIAADQPRFEQAKAALETATDRVEREGLFAVVDAHTALERESVRAQLRMGGAAKPAAE